MEKLFSKYLCVFFSAFLLGARLRTTSGNEVELSIPTSTDINFDTFDTELGTEVEEHIRKNSNLILNGVNKVFTNSTNNVYGTLTVFGEKAFSILAGLSNGLLKPNVGGTEYGLGRIIAITHTTMLLPNSAGFDNTKLFINCVTWVGRRDYRLVGVYLNQGNANNVLSVLSANSLSGQIISGTNINNATFLSQFAALIINSIAGRSLDGAIIRQYIRNGGGLILGTTPWAAGDLYAWGNQFLTQTGLSYVPRSTLPTITNGFDASFEFIKDTHTLIAWRDLKNIINGKASTNHLKGIVDDRILFGV